MIFLHPPFSTWIWRPVCYDCIRGDFMHRIENRYKWKTLKHWKTAVEAEAVQVKIIEETGIEDSLLEKAIALLENNCFPVTMICCQKEKRQKEIWMTPLWAEIFDFLGNRRCIVKDGGKLSFTEMEAEEQHAILNARIESIWITED